MLKPIFDKLFGEDWKEKDKNFWDEFDAKQKVTTDDKKNK